MPTRKPSETYSPLYFLASVGAGGLTVTFFMWLMFWIPHPGKTVPVFEDIMAAFAQGNPLTQAMLVIAMAGIAFFAFQNIKLLIWNLQRYSAWRKTDAFQTFSKTNAQSQVLALPLALAMAVNGGFILGLVFVPDLWSIVEYLFPLAMVAFLAIGVLALKQYGNFLGRVLTEGGFNCAANNNFGQILPAFAFSMVGVGMAAPAAMSTSATVAGASIAISTFFLMTSALIAVVAMILGLRSMMENGANADTAPTLLIIVPLLTVLGILMLRQAHGFGVHFGVESGAGATLSLTSKLLGAQFAILLFGGLVLVKQGYAGRFLFGSENSAGAYALICPGVALSVMMQFFLNNGLVKAGIVDKFGIAFWVITALAIAAQFAMVWLVLLLNRRHFGTPKGAEAVPAE
ncbi:hypothetical protein ROE7235_00132 [Roseibaca ekhonensis]|uniref:Uncharacterized protein n=1 Tax=Roseinatronobacter ekhonensis TaxID=254356 RepID=A0A3B0M2M2_9RHOB|nr:hypothetical protein [Roseibaca ekhonensis]SUZ30411.1 hypothetical protein ROE7235_00132 [Roseibaca ekhonensis]